MQQEGSCFALTSNNGSRGYCISTIGIDEERIREYVKWQEEKEQEMEQLQGELFDEAED